MCSARRVAAIGALSQAALLIALAMTVGLHEPGWTAGVGSAAVASVAVVGGFARYAHALRPADLVTLTRVALACGVAALVADALAGRQVVVALVTLAVAALVLDAVDGLVARRTRSASTFGARFDGEVDAFVMLVLSVYVAYTVAGWVLVIGAARYAFAVAGWVLPWLRAQLPPRYWRKVVTAVQGVVLAVAAAGILPHWLTVVTLGGALVLLAESFGRDVLWLWRHHRTASPDREYAAGSEPSVHVGNT